MDFIVKPKIIKLLGNNTGEKICDFALVKNFFIISQMHDP